jgi:hypothetical protein
MITSASSKAFNGTHNRVKFDILFYLGFFTHPGGIYQHKIMTVLVIMDMDRIARSTCNWGNYITVGTNNELMIDDLPTFGRPTMAYLGRVFSSSLNIFEMFNHLVQ